MTVVYIPTLLQNGGGVRGNKKEQEIRRYLDEARDPDITEHQRDLLYQEVGKLIVEGYDPARYKWSDTPQTGDDLCLACYEYRRYPDWQQHFGFAWWKTCGWDCTHEHHRDEVWRA
jgi:hypothetical protein